MQLPKRLLQVSTRTTSGKKKKNHVAAEETLEEVLEAFDFGNPVVGAKRFGYGHINDTFCDPNCNATQICKKFNISASVLSQLFKKKFDIGFLDYITSLRIDRAKYYLESSEKNIDEISVLIGYTTTRSFFRAFKRIEGITPGQYRKNFIK